MKEQSPLISIIIPSYNRADLIGETLDSVLNQTYQNWECIVVDDGSTDNTDKIMQQLMDKDSRIHYYHRQREPKGAPTCRNIGLNKARGEYVIFLDSDDLLTDFCLKRRVQLFEKYPDNDFLVFQSSLFNNKKDDLNIYWNVETGESDLQRFLRIEALWTISGPIYKRDFIIKMNGFKEDLPFWQDTELGVRLISSKSLYKKFLTEVPDLYIRLGEDRISKKINRSDQKETIYKRIQILSLFSSLLKKNSVVLSNEEFMTLWSSGYIFCGNLLLNFNSHRGFFNSWYRFNLGMNRGLKRFVLGYILQYLYYFRKYSIYFIKIRNIYSSLLGTKIPNMKEFSKKKIYQVEITKE